MRSRSTRQSNQDFIRKSRNTISDSSEKKTDSSNYKKKKSSSNKNNKKRHKQNFKKKSQKKRKSRILTNFLEVFLSIFITLLIVSIVSFFLIGFSKVQGYGMSPTLNSGEYILYRKTAKIKRFDLVVFNRGGKKQIRRVIGLPGESIEYQDDTLIVDGKPVDEKFIIDEINEAQKNGGKNTDDFSLNDLTNETTIPNGKYLLLGDNRSYATDGRVYGLIDKGDILGVVKIRFLPLNELQAF